MLSVEFANTLQPRSNNKPEDVHSARDATSLRLPAGAKGDTNCSGFGHEASSLSISIAKSPTPTSTSDFPEASPTAACSSAPWTPSYSPSYKANTVQVTKGFQIPLPPPSGAGSRGGGYSGDDPRTPLKMGSTPIRGGATPTIGSSSQRIHVRGTPDSSVEPLSPVETVSPMDRRKDRRGTRDLDASPRRLRVGEDRTPTGGSIAHPLSPAARRNRATPQPQKSTSRIDPEQVPRPVDQSEAVKVEGGKVYETTKYQMPPSATGIYTIVDRGSCSCEFMRCTTNQVPAYPSTANTAHIPVAVSCQPFAELTPHEIPIPLVDFGEIGPLRCARCKAYVNSFFTFHTMGTQACCNFCGHRMNVPENYICSLDDKGRRTDINDRPELQRGSVDYVAPRDYSDEMLPGRPVVVVGVDASMRSIKSGLFFQVISTLLALVSFPQEAPPRIALLFFDQVLHFFCFDGAWEDAREVVVADIEDPFVPCGHETLCANVEDDLVRVQFEALLERLQETYSTKPPTDQAAGGAALKAATEVAASSGGGHVIMFHGTLPNTGVGALRNRDDIKLYGTPEGAGLMLPQQAPFYDDIARECLAKGVAVSVFCCPDQNEYLDVATLSAVPRRTGGEVIRIPGFCPGRDGELLHHSFSRSVVQGAVYSCVFKLRCSKGLTVEAMYAPWDAEVIDPSTFHLSRMSVDATAVFLLTHSERVENQKFAYMQAACLYTDKRGARLIRVHTLQLPVTTSLSNVFRYTEVDSVTSLLLKQAACMALTGNGAFKEKITKACVNMLHAYRVNCASMTSMGQLILPESLKLLPLYISSIRKMPAFRSGSDIRVDDRMTRLIHLIGMPLAQVPLLVYPRVYTLSPLFEGAGNPTGVADNVHKPPALTCSVDKMAMDRIFLVDNGLLMMIYIREEVTADCLYEAFGVEDPREVQEIVQGYLSGQADATVTGVRIASIVLQLRKERNRLPWQPVHVALHGTAEEGRLLSMLVEDRAAGEMHYVDFLCHVHKLVQNKLD